MQHGETRSECGDVRNDKEGTYLVCNRGNFLAGRHASLNSGHVEAGLYSCGELREFKSQIRGLPGERPYNEVRTQFIDAYSVSVYLVRYARGP